MSASLKDVLGRHSFLYFDGVDAVWSFKVAAELSLRRNEFDSCMNGMGAARVTPNKILDSIVSKEMSHIPYYRAIDSIGSFDAIPFTKKELILLNPSSFLANSGGPYWSKLTSGTTGKPLCIYQSAAFLFKQRFLDVREITDRAGLRIDPMPGCITCIHFTDSPNTIPEVFVSPLDTNDIYVRLPLSAANSKFLEEIRPQVITGRPEVLQMLAAANPFSIMGAKAVISSGSTLSDSCRAEITKAFQARCINVYALTEFGVVASECQHGRLHIDDTSVFLEVISCGGPGNSHSDIMGEIVISGHGNKAQPLTRYRTGDIGIYHTKQCSCGQTGPVISIQKGRLVPLFQFSGQRPFSPTCFSDLNHRFEIDEFQIIQSGTNRMDILIQGPCHTSSICEQVGNHTRAFLPRSVEVKVRWTEFDPTRKRERFIRS